MTSSGRANRGPRAAAENRQALLDAAREVFSDGGLGVPFSAIARTAGVGQGVLYRHFPDRIDLAMAVFEENLVELEHLSVDPERQLEDLLELVTTQVIESVAFVEMVHATADDHRLDEVTERLGRALESKLRTARTDGTVRPDLETADLIVAIGMIANLVARLPAPDRRPTASTAWSLLWGGLRPR